MSGLSLIIRFVRCRLFLRGLIWWRVSCPTTRGRAARDHVKRPRRLTGQVVNGGCHDDRCEPPRLMCCDLRRSRFVQSSKILRCRPCQEMSQTPRRLSVLRYYPSSLFLRAPVLEQEWRLPPEYSLGVHQTEAPARQLAHPASPDEQKPDTRQTP